MKILYFGNKTSNYKASKSMLETLEPLFGEFTTVKSASSYKNQGLRLLAMIWLFIKSARTADLILIDVYSTRAFIYTQTISSLSRLRNKKYVLILHGGNLPYRFKQKEQSMRKIFSKAHAVAAPSNYLKQFFDAQGIPTLYIPNIIELQMYPWKKRTKFSPHFLSIRGFDSPYNPLMTLRALHLLKADYPNLILHFVGANTEAKYPEIVKYISENGLEKNVHLIPKMPKKEWIKLSEQSDFMISNPVIDNTPVSVIEGMALGLVIISTNVGGVPYLVGDNKNAVLVESDDHVGLALKIKNLLTNQKFCEQLALSGREKATTFDWAIVKNDWKQLFSNS